MKSEEYHEPVLLRETIAGLKLERFAHLKRPPRVIDATLGTAGHAQEIVKTGAELLGIDADAEVLGIAKKRLSKLGGGFKLVQGNFRKIDQIAKANGFDQVDAIVFDLGVANVHLKADSRGFSFEDPLAPLDMRLDPSIQAVKAKDLLNVLRKDQLEAVFGQAMNGAEAKEVAGRVVEARASKPFEEVGDLLEALQGFKERKLHPATRVFLALRMATASELENLAEALPLAFELLTKRGRLAVISFHSAEERIVKEFFRKVKDKALVEEVVTPSLEEIARNPRSRSARLRILEKI